jgi:MFS family permease
VAAIERKSVRNLAIIYFAAWMRSFGIGLLGVVLGVFLYREGFSSPAIGLVIAAGLAGAATGTVFITFKADRLGRRQTLFALSLLTATGSLPLIFHFGLAAMIVIAFLGMLNGMGTDRSPAFALEQATIPGLVADEKRTWALAWYSVVLDASGALGALAAGIPILAQKLWRVDLGHSYRLLFIGYAAISVLTGLLYLLLSPEVEVRKAGSPLQPKTAISRETKSTVKRLSALFALDAFGGGFLTDALVSYWFFRRFGIASLHYFSSRCTC